MAPAPHPPARACSIKAVTCPAGIGGEFTSIGWRVRDMRNRRSVGTALFVLFASGILGCSEQNPPTTPTNQPTALFGTAVGTASSTANVVVHWNEVALNTILGDAST